MTQEEKQLLLIDLCARLPHKVKIKCDGYPYGITVTGVVGDQIFHTPYFIGGEIIINKHTIDTVRPYLRPMSSMMQGEWEEMTALIYPYGRVNRNPDNKNELLLWLSAEENEMPIILMNNVFSWLNKNMFDYRGLIPMGLALEASEGIYNI